ncbi:hypothetical protein B0H11DRAFT_1944273 [Mycena galericulata]|nr:hypothetical protein B0H11DRAFT_1944273 [Mycena galericulata]
MSTADLAMINLLLIFEGFSQVDVHISEFWDKRHASSSPLWWFWMSNLKATPDYPYKGQIQSSDKIPNRPGQSWSQNSDKSTFGPHRSGQKFGQWVGSGAEVGSALGQLMVALPPHMHNENVTFQMNYIHPETATMSFEVLLIRRGNLWNDIDIVEVAEDDGVAE